MPVEELQGNLFNWFGFERFGAASSNPVTALAFTSATTTGGSHLFQSGAADAADEYGAGFGYRQAYTGTGALNGIRSGIIVPGVWKRLFVQARVRIVTSAIASGNKHELIAVRNAAGNTVFGVQFERTASGLHFREFIGHPASSAHPAGATEYVANTQTTNRATNTWFTLLLVAEAVYAGGSQLNLSLYVNGTQSGSTINDSALTGGPFDPHAVMPGGSYQIIVGSYGMNNAVNTQNENFDILRFGCTPNAALVGA